MMDTCHYTPNPKEFTTARIISNVNWRLWVIIMCNVDSPILTDVPLWWGIWTVGGEAIGYAFTCTVDIWEISVLSSQFFYEP